MSASMPVSTASTSAAAAEGATPKHGRPLGVEVGDGGAHGGGLAGAGGSDDEDQAPLPRHRGRGVALDRR